ncbi:hypothetical protein EDC94DRAFT_599251 [Helicostylum pulchrum]|nr:hypothetical protein EDC94DRAFT_599251 [Helicostylum pulchrum]
MDKIKRRKVSISGKEFGVKEERDEKGNLPPVRRNKKFKVDETDLLMEKFREEPYISEDAKMKLAERFNTTPECISIWFQNRRAQQSKAARSRKEKTEQAFSRWRFTAEVIKAMETEFKKTPFLTKEGKESLVKQLEIPPDTILTWFRDRRIKEKKTGASTSQSPE